MAIQISYPNANNVTLSDRLIGTQYDPEFASAVTKNFSLSSIANLAKEVTLTDGVSGIFETNSNDNWEITVVDGLITKIDLIG
jgi:hypothetical protein